MATSSISKRRAPARCAACRALSRAATVPPEDHLVDGIDVGDPELVVDVVDEIANGAQSQSGERRHPPLAARARASHRISAQSHRRNGFRKREHAGSDRRGKCPH